METDLLRDRVYDTVGICQRSDRPKFLGFLSDEEAVLVEGTVSTLSTQYEFFGGYDDATRVMLGCFPEWDYEKHFPITPITFKFRRQDILTHRDVLGSLMALGLKRETVGDILIEEGRAVVFVTEENADFIMSQIYKIGRVGVTSQKGFSEPLPQAGTMVESSVTVASNRLDCVVAALIGASRNKATEIIEQSLVSVNSVISEKTTLRLSDGDIISIRKKGKFKIESQGDKTRKDRIILKFKKYV